MPAEKHLTVTEAAAALRMSRQRLNKLLVDGRIPGTRFGNAWMLRESDVKRFKPMPPGRPRIPEKSKNSA